MAKLQFATLGNLTEFLKNAADIAALQGLVGDGYEAIPSASIKALFTA